MLMALDLKRTYTAILDNAYQVSYEKNREQNWQFRFLPCR